MTSDGIKALTLTEKLDEMRGRMSVEQVDGGVPPSPAKPMIAEIITPSPGEHLLAITLTLKEIAACAASMQTAVHSGWVRQPSDLNTINSVLRKFHDAKLQYVRDHPDAH